MGRRLVIITTITLLVWAGGNVVTAGARPGDPTSTTVPAHHPKPTPKPKLHLTPVQALLARSSPDTGELSKRDALRLFAMVFGRIPGVEVPRSRVPADGTVAVEAVLAHIHEYTPKQQRAIRRRLDPPGAVKRTLVLGDTATATPTAAIRGEPAASAVFTAAPGRPSTQQLGNTVDAQLTQFYNGFRSSDRLGPAATLKRVEYRFVPLTDPDPKKSLLGWVTPGDEPGVCEMYLVAPLLTAGLGPNTVAHELFHCLQHVIAPGTTGGPKWVVEGSAEYAGDEVQPVKDYSWWTAYVTMPFLELFKRTYDAVGFFAHLQEIGINPYKKIPTMLAAATSEAAFTVSGADSDTYLDSWASGFFRGSVPGKDWTMSWPGIARLGARAKPIALNLPKDLPEGRMEIADPYANLIYRLDTSADVVEIETKADSRVRVSDGRTDVKVNGTNRFCTRTGGCPCPADDVSGGSGLLAASTPDDLIPLKHTASIAMTGGTAGSQAVLTTYSLANYCCAEPTHAVNAGGLKITPHVGCRMIGLKIQHPDPLKLEVGYALLVNHPRLRATYETKNGKKRLVGVDLEGVDGILLDFGAGAAVPDANRNFDVSVPVEAEVPVFPHRPGTPASMKVRWTVIVKTAFGSANSTLWSRGRYTFSGPLGVKNGNVLQPDLTADEEERILNGLGGITEAPGGIVVAVKTQFTGDKGVPADLKGVSSSVSASFGVAQGSALGSPLLVCHGASLTVVFAAQGGRIAGVKSQIFDKSQVVPEGFQSCGPVAS